MDLYYIIVLSIATVVLVLILTYIGILMTNAKNKQEYPPSYNTCPDYWTSDGSGNCIKGVMNVGSGSGINLSSSATPGGNGTTGFNSNDPGWATYKSASNQRCGWQKWANKHKITWDGVTNYNGC